MHRIEKDMMKDDRQTDSQTDSQTDREPWLIQLSSLTRWTSNRTYNAFCLQSIMLSDRSHTKWRTRDVILFVWTLQSKSLLMESRSMVTWKWRSGTKVTRKGLKKNLPSAGNVLRLSLWRWLHMWIHLSKLIKLCNVNAWTLLHMIILKDRERKEHQCNRIKFGYK